MIKTEPNINLLSLEGDYIFVETARAIREHEKKNPTRRIIKLGIGDTSLSLPKIVTYAMMKAAAETGERAIGYQPECGSFSLREKISEYYGRRKILLSPDEIYVSDGAKSDIGNLFDLFGDVPVVMQKPYYPPYLGNAVMRGMRCIFIHANASNNYVMSPDELKSHEPALIIICSPNNPTGKIMERDLLESWVERAVRDGSIILFDAAYECFVENGIKSIYEIENASNCAIEVASLSKSAGFTSLRCGWCVIPKELEFADNRGNIGKIWKRRQSERFNGISYVTSKAAEAALSDDGVRAGLENIFVYKRSGAEFCRFLREVFPEIGFVGGHNSPYIWVKLPNRFKDSREAFRYLLEKYGIAVTPGCGFGGEGYVRISAFAPEDDIFEAERRMLGRSYD